MTCGKCRSPHKIVPLQCAHAACMRCVSWRGTVLTCPVCRAKTREAHNPRDIELSTMQLLTLGIIKQALHDVGVPRRLLRRKRRVIERTGLPPKRFAFSYSIAMTLAQDAKRFLLDGLWEEDCPYRHALVRDDLPRFTKERIAVLVREQAVPA